MNNELAKKIEKIKAVRNRLKCGEYNGNDIMQAWIAIDALIDCKTALAQQQEEEPVAWVSEGALKRLSGNQIVAAMGSEHDGVQIPLYLHPPKPAAQPQVPEGIAEKYNELLYHVARKFPNESRHETALRYIKNAEPVESYCAAEKEES